MLKSFYTRIKRLIARLCIDFLARCGMFDGFFSDWRWALFDYAEKRGLHILPVHYYTPIPDLRGKDVNNQNPRYFGANDKVLGEAMTLLAQLQTEYGETYTDIRTRTPGTPVTQFAFGPAPYNPVEAEALYGLIRTRKPRQIVEIGSGHTTFLIAEAIRDEKETGYLPTFTCIEPYRPPYLETLPKEVSSFIDKSLQDVDLDFFRSLGAGDILFIDSSHVVAYDTDTVYELLEILPLLQKGVLIHFHDIFLPYEYPPEWLTRSKFFWAEQYMLAAMLRDNPGYRVILPLYQLYRQRHDELSALFPMVETDKYRPSALWIEVV